MVIFLMTSSATTDLLHLSEKKTQAVVKAILWLSYCKNGVWWLALWQDRITHRNDVIIGADTQYWSVTHKSIKINKGKKYEIEQYSLVR